MPWIKLDVNFLEHPKIDALSCDAKLLHLWALCYAGRQLTDGFVPTKQVCDKLLIVEELVTALLWHKVTGGYEIHDYLEHQSSREQVKKVRESTRKRVAKHREKENVTPLLTPDVLALEVEGRNRNRSKDISASLSQFLAIYPRKDGGMVANQKALDKALKVATLDEILSGANRYANDPNRSSTYTKMPATWLNKGCWNDPLLPVQAFSPAEARKMPTQVPARLQSSDLPSGGVPMPDYVRQSLKK